MGNMLRAKIKKIVRYVIDKSNIHKFMRLETARRLDAKNISSLYKLLKGGEHFEAPMVVNDISTAAREHFRLIDGNHRLVVIEKVIREDPGFSIEVTFVVYDHLDDAAERRVYDYWNSGKAQSTADMIQVNQKDFPLFLMMQKWFPAPVTLYGLTQKQRGLRFDLLAKAYIGRFLPYRPHMRLLEFLKEAKTLGNEAYEYLKDFAADFIGGFGDPVRGNLFNRTVGVESLMKIHACNLDAGTLARQDIVNRWRAKVANDSNIRTLIATSGFSGISDICKAMVAGMNRGYFRHLAITPEEYKKQKQENGGKP